MNYKEIYVSLFRDFRSNPHPVKLDKIIDGIRRGTFSEQIETLRSHLNDEHEYGEHKRKLPSFTPSGVFIARRKKENLDQYSQLIVLDIDHIDERTAEVRGRASQIEYTVAAFVSPGGKGLKIIAYVDSSAEEHETAYNELVNFYERVLDVEIDKSGKDVTRTCFVSFDPELYLNTAATAFNYTTHTAPPEFTAPTVSGNSHAEIFQKAVEFTTQKSEFREGNRNNFIYLLACNCNREGLIEHIALTMIMEYFPGLPVNEIEQTVLSAYSNRHEFNSYHTTFSNPGFANTHSAAPETQLVCTLNELIERNMLEPKPEFIWNGIKEGSFGYIYGPPKSGKTIFCENLGMSIAAGIESFMGFSIDQSKERSVLFIGMEEFWRNRAARSQIQLAALDGIDPKTLPFFVITENFPGRLSTKDDWQKLEKIIVEKHPDVVFIDSLTRTVNGEIEISSDSRDASFSLREMVRKYGITLIMIHHSTKLDGRELDIDKLAGSRVIAQEADFIYGINRIDNKRYFKEVANRYKQEDEGSIMFNINDNLWIEKIIDLSDHITFPTIDYRTNPEKDEMILNAAISLMGPDSKVKIINVVHEIESDISRSEVYRRVKILAEKGELTIKGGFISVNHKHT